MSGDWLIPYYVLWGLVLIQSVLIIVLFRQLGIVYIRIGPKPAATTQNGPEIGSQIQPLKVSLIDGSPFIIGGSMGKPLLMVFTVPNCPTCEVLLPGVVKFRKAEKHYLDVALVTDAREIKNGWGGGIPLIQSPEVFDALKVQGTPYGVVLDEKGIVKSKGIVNHIEHLESLANALETGYATLSEKQIHDTTKREEESLI